LSPTRTCRPLAERSSSVIVLAAVIVQTMGITEVSSSMNREIHASGGDLLVAPKDLLRGDHLYGKPGNVRDFDRYQGNVRDFTKSAGNVWGKIL